MVEGRTDSQIPSDFHVYTMAFVGPYVEVCVCVLYDKQMYKTQKVIINLSKALKNITFKILSRACNRFKNLLRSFLIASP